MRTDQVGSLLRPEGLKAAFLRFGEGRLSEEGLRKAQDEAIREVVAKQEAHGVPVVTDGEYRRLNWQVSFSRVRGWDLWGGSWRHFLQNPDQRGAHEKPLTRGDDAVVSFRAPATARLELEESFPLGEYRFLKTVAKGPAKVTLMFLTKWAKGEDLHKD